MDDFLTTYEHDENVALTEKIQCLKTLRVLVKNLTDPAKVQDEKYRQFKRNNPKIEMMIKNSAIASYLQQSIGFIPITDTGNRDEITWKIEKTIDSAAMSREYIQVSCTLERIEALLDVPIVPSSSSSPHLKKSRTLQHASSSLSTDSTSSSISIDTRLSEKQKARMLAEQKQAMEKEQAKLARQRTKELIQADKMVRQNDPNWKPSVSAAAEKNGSAMLTFRDKYGES